MSELILSFNIRGQDGTIDKKGDLPVPRIGERVSLDGPGRYEVDEVNHTYPEDSGFIHSVVWVGVVPLTEASDRRDFVREEIRQQMEETGGIGAETESVVESLSEIFERGAVEHTIQRLREEGNIYSPSEGYVRVV